MRGAEHRECPRRCSTFTHQRFLQPYARTPPRTAGMPKPTNAWFRSQKSLAHQKGEALVRVQGAVPPAGVKGRRPFRGACARRRAQRPEHCVFAEGTTCPFVGLRRFAYERLRISTREAPYLNPKPSVSRSGPLRGSWQAFPEGDEKKMPPLRILSEGRRNLKTGFEGAVPLWGHSPSGMTTGGMRSSHAGRSTATRWRRSRLEAPTARVKMPASRRQPGRVTSQ